MCQTKSEPHETRWWSDGCIILLPIRWAEDCAILTRFEEVVGFFFIDKARLMLKCKSCNATYPLIRRSQLSLLIGYSPVFYIWIILHSSLIWLCWNTVGIKLWALCFLEALASKVDLMWANLYPTLAALLKEFYHLTKKIRCWYSLLTLVLVDNPRKRLLDYKIKTSFVKECLISYDTSRTSSLRYGVSS